MILLTKLLLAHLAGDFILQPDSWIQEKKLKRYRSPKFYLHVLIHGALALLIVWDPAFWLPAAIILISHYVIDLAKVTFENRNKILWFITDQLLHLLVIGLVWYYWEHPALSFSGFPTSQVLIVFTAAVFLTNPTSVIIKTFISHWTPDTLYTVSTSLPDAGKIIGYLERLLVLMFVLSHHWEAVGFLLAAKSVFRFGNLKESHDRKLTEYVLIGTLLSFGIALIVAVGVAFLMTFVPNT